MRTTSFRPSWADEPAEAAGWKKLLAALVGLVLFICGRWSVRDTCSAPLSSGPAQREVAPEAYDSLYDPPAGHGVVAVPSTLRDARGEIHNMDIAGARFNVLVSKAGTMRSGDVHRWPQYDTVFRGLVQVTTRESGKDVMRTYTSGDRILIPPNIPHMFTFVNDTVMAEWWAGPFEARYYRPYRSQVDAAMERLQYPRRSLGERGRKRLQLPRLGKLRDTLGQARRRERVHVPPRQPPLP